MGSDKRTRLIEAANKLIHQQGFNLTTLADIARESEVPLGNVYYYFKTKEEIGSALIEHRANFYRGMIESWNRLPDPKQRLAALIEMVSGERETLAQSGCPIGSLCQELHKDGGPLADKSASLMAAMLSWAEQQFRLLGKEKESPDLALHVVSVLQGASLLTHTFRQPDLIARETVRLKKWIDSL
ncbi:TetR family transcriptional regulator [Sulfuricaulis limicola]|uniref:TetR family transcriptional regulator n=1 Tax=Sulfuricaulis limicola TaxID=1620215 RepID=A0A1B4XC94_9GAMM|nr:TetR/AcrR family transcriptional regulator [Sulfuricaulis limicola]BAV32411.1 TetR family transcriptional regulator [Sulfuricaulis limicola]